MPTRRYRHRMTARHDYDERPGRLRLAEHALRQPRLPGRHDQLHTEPGQQDEEDHARPGGYVGAQSPRYGGPATRTPAVPPVIRISRPAVRAARRASPVTISHALAIAKARVITHRSVVPVPARALTVSATGS